ncbi:MAG: aldo/keto reductase [Armatimonadetes bacterium]|nr:aldo/keto reductase [Armatimonadota bacterium]
MEYRNLGKAGVRVSRACLGTMMFGGPTPEGESREIIRAALAAGINFLDTADKYNDGESERVVGRAIADCRDRVVLATKVGTPMGPGPNDAGASRKHLRLAVEASLRRLGTDYIDLYYLHLPDPGTPLEETLAALDDLVTAGKVLYVACSNFRAWQVAHALGLQALHHWAPFAAVQPLYNLANRDVEVELLPMCAALGPGVVTYSPLARGVLTGKYRAGSEPPPDSRAARGNVRLLQTEYREANFALARELGALAAGAGCTPSQLAIAWVLGNPLVTSVLLGPRTLTQFQDNLAALDVALSGETEAAVDRLVPPGEHSGRGYQDPGFPVTGRPPAARA